MATLPQLTGDAVYLTDGGLETTLVFLEGLDLPDFAAFPLLESTKGRAALDRYYPPYLDLAERSASASSWTPPPGARTVTGASASGTTTRLSPT